MLGLSGSALIGANCSATWSSVGGERLSLRARALIYHRPFSPIFFINTEKNERVGPPPLVRILPSPQPPLPQLRT